MALNHVFIGDPKSKKILVFLHEGLGSIEQWKKFPAKLCALTNSYGLVYDRAGYGKSEGSLRNRKTDYLHKGADELNLILSTLVSSQYQIFLYGHSDGGSIALIYSAQYPAKIKGIITEAAHVFVEKETLAGVRNALPLFNVGKFNGLKKYHGNRFKEVFLAWNTIWLSEGFKTWGITNILHRITAKQLIIQGDTDQYGTLKQVATIKSKTKGETQVYIPKNTGHSPHKEAEENTLLIASNFINAI